MPTYNTPEGKELHYSLHGDGDTPMLMLHGLSQSSITFKGLLPELIPDRQVILCDLPGHGGSYRLDHYEAEPMVQDIAGLLQSITDKPAIVYGHSLGSLIATGLAAEHSDCVSQLILSDPPLIVWDKERWQDSIISSYFGWARKIRRAGYPAEQIIPMLQAAFPHRSQEVLQDQAAALCQLDVAIIDALFDNELTTLDEVLAQFERLHCPTLLLQADPTVLAAASDADIAAIQARCPTTEHIQFKGADHDLHLWKQDRVLEAVKGFIDP